MNSFLNMYCLKGETIKNWRPRYFYLMGDGSLRGFKGKQDNPFIIEPLNNFTVKDCQIMKMDRPKPFTFMIRGLQWTRVIERTFYADTEQDRQEWLDAIENVSATLKAALAMGGAMGGVPLSSSYVLNSQPQQQQQHPLPQPSTSFACSPMDDIVMLDADEPGSVNNDTELYHKFVVRGTAYGNKGKKKVVSYVSIAVPLNCISCKQIYNFYFRLYTDI